MIRSIIFISLFIGCYMAHSQEADTRAVDIMNRTIESTREIKTMSYNMTKIERIDGEMIRQISSCKMIRNPLSVYLRQKYPNDGLEILYNGGEKVLINPNGFPWFNLRLSPVGNMVRANQHHTVLESGYDHVINILDHLINKYRQSANSMLSIKKDTVWENHPVWKVELQNPYYEISDYVMQKNETVMQIARRDLISEYWLVEQNDILNSYNDEKPGETIKRPNDYALSMELYIDKTRFIPLVMKVYDNSGLFEFYSYSEVKINPTFKDSEFEKDYAEYKF